MKPFVYWLFEEVLWMAAKLCMERTVFISKVLCGGPLEMEASLGKKQ